MATSTTKAINLGTLDFAKLHYLPLCKMDKPPSSKRAKASDEKEARNLFVLCYPNATTGVVEPIVHVQFGKLSDANPTTAKPNQALACWRGMSRWSAADKKYYKVDNNKDAKWVKSLQKSEKAKMATANLAVNVALTEYNTPGTEAALTYAFLQRLEELQIDIGVNGVKLPDGTVYRPPDFKCNGESAAVMRTLMNTTLSISSTENPKTGRPYDPVARLKFRVFGDQAIAEPELKTSAHIFEWTPKIDDNTPHSEKEVDDPIEFLAKNAVQGAWMLQLEPVQFTGKDIRTPHNIEIARVEVIKRDVTTDAMGD